jgi:transposase
LDQKSASWVLEQLESLNREQLIQVILDQHRMIQELRAEIEQLKRRGGAAPFSKGIHKPDPKAPGRKPGQGFFRFRGAPEAGSLLEPVAVRVAGCCPECGGDFGEARTKVVSITDIPMERRPEVRSYAVETRQCGQCGKSVRGRHPDIAVGQQGATAHRVGPRVKALAHVIHYAHGVPVRKVPAIVEDLTGVRLTQGAITQHAMAQTSGEIGARYADLRGLVQKQAVAHTDDTGWRVGGRTAFLMAFVNPALAVYQIRNRHRNEEVRELIPADFKGILICDRGKSYDAEELLGLRQQKCLAHLLRNASEIANRKTGRAREFSRQLKDLLRAALALRAARTQLDAPAYREKALTIEEQLTHHLRNRILRDDDNQRLLNGVGAQQDRGHLLRFLFQDEVEATNNRAERDLRPAVIARKVSHCSRNERGARAFEAFTSVIQTLRRTSSSPIGIAFQNLFAQAPPISP